MLTVEGWGPSLLQLLLEIFIIKCMRLNIRYIKYILYNLYSGTVVMMGINGCVYRCKIEWRRHKAKYTTPGAARGAVESVEGRTSLKLRLLRPFVCNPAEDLLLATGRVGALAGTGYDEHVHLRAP